MSDLEQQHRQVTKTVLLAQLFLESLDDLKHTRYYKQDVKNVTNTLEKKLERFLVMPNQYLMGEAEETMMILSRGMEKIIKLTLEDIYEQDDKSRSL